jgi:glycosyltransferase involved in cell wall biosynthesis
MRIGVELRQIVPGSCGGIVPLLAHVLATAFGEHPQHEYHLFCTEDNVGLFESLPANVVQHLLPRYRYFSLLDDQAFRLRLDVLFRSFPMQSLLIYPWNRQVALVPDLQHEAWPNFFDKEVLTTRRDGFNSILENAAAIASISDHARSTIREHPATKCQDVFLMCPALVETPLTTVEQLSDDERRALPVGDFFLYPGNLWPHKNHRRTLEAFQLFLQHCQRPVELILTGHPDGWPRLAADFPGLPVRHLGFVRREMLQVLLQHARALLFFSLFEGFGMPLLEAFAAGTPVLCSNTTSLPEVGGDAVLTCDPTNATAMADLMKRIVSEHELAEGLIKAGKKRLDIYNWSDSARHLIEACTRVAERAPELPQMSPAKLVLLRVARAFRHPRQILWPYLSRETRRTLLIIGQKIRRQGIKARNFVRQTKQRLHRLFKSRLGMHHQYPPEPVRVPRLPDVTLPGQLPLISIVTPSYNQAPFLERTLRSVLDQDYPRLEYIIQDGGSTDGSVDILERYSDRLAHWESRRDRGQTHAINLGFEHSHGDIMAYLNSDDVLLSGSLGYVARFFHDHPDVDVIYSHRLIIDPDDQEVGRWILPFHDDDILAWNDYVPQETLFWRRRAWDRIGAGLDENFHFAMDWDMLLRLRDVGARFVRVPRYLAAFRVHPEQKTSSRMADMGAPEIARLRLRSLGRTVTEDEVQLRVRPYLRRHIMMRILHRLGLSA